MRQMIWLLLALGCKPNESSQQTPLAEGFQMGAERCCDDPTTGTARLTERGMERGFTQPLPDTVTAMGFDIPGVGGAVAAGDLDADGDLDLVLGGLDSWLDFYINDGTGHFTHYRYSFRTDEEGPPTSYANGLVDLTGDLLPELVLAMPGRVRILENMGGLVWKDWATLEPDYGEHSYVYQTAVFGDLDADGDLDFFLPSMEIESEGEAPAGPSQEGGPDTVYLQVDDGDFLQAADLWVTDTGSRVQVATLTDRDMDGDLDILSLSDLGPPSAFWRNEGLQDGELQLVNDATDIGAGLEIAAMGVDSSDLNRDGLLDFCMSDVGPPRCLLSDEQGHYYEAAFALGMTISQPVADHLDTVGWSVELVDLDNSGWPELVQASGPDPGAWEQSILDIPDVIWWADNQGGWYEGSQEDGFSDTANHIGMVSGDFNQDGSLDLVVAGPDQLPLYFENSCGAEAWLEIELIGPPENTDGIGARVEVTSGGETQIREIMSIRDKAQTASRIHLGLGDVEDIERVTVTWPDGHTMESEGVLPRRLLTVRHPDAPDVEFAPYTGEYPESVQADSGQILVYGLILDALDDSGLPDATVQDLNGNSTTSDFDGKFQIAVEENANVDIRLTHADDLVPILISMQSDWQKQLHQGLTSRMITENNYSMMHSGVLGITRDTSLGSLWVGGRGDGTIYLDLSAEYEAALVIGDSMEEGQDLTPEDNVVMFMNVEPGEVEVLKTVENGSCMGRQTVPVEAGQITTVYVECSGQ